MNKGKFKLEKAILKKRHHLDNKNYWAKKSPQERLEAVEFLRQTFYDYNPITDRVQRIFLIAKQPWS